MSRSLCILSGPRTINASDICTKFKDDAPRFIHSKEWRNGPSWLQLQPDQWPVVVEECQAQGAALSGLDQSSVSATSCEPTFSFKSDVKGEYSHVFSQTLVRCSSVIKVTRVIARIRNCFKKRSFKSLKDSPTKEQTREAFSTLVALEQVNMEPQKSLMAYKHNGLMVTSQRWTKGDHTDLFGVPFLPILPADGKLGAMLLQYAHHPTRGPCRGDRHCWLALRTGDFACFLFGKAANQLKRVKSNCVECIKRHSESYSAPMQPDRFKSVSKLDVWSSISVDMTGQCGCQMLGLKE